MINIHNKFNCNVIASKKVNKKDVSRWGILKIKKINKRNFSIKDVVEKPSIKKAPSNLAIIGRYVLPKKIFKILPNIKKGKGGEFHITDAIKSLVNSDDNFIGYIFKGTYLDCGSMKGYINSSKEISKI
jgi:UTP--glucose-1-phosphate uridylyltransferase|tara:strand:- start:359 stop:745 length:387 start_codon:yes stop_codon:yes gene_type:complete